MHPLLLLSAIIFLTIRRNGRTSHLLNLDYSLRLNCSDVEVVWCNLRINHQRCYISTRTILSGIQFSKTSPNCISSILHNNSLPVAIISTHVHILSHRIKIKRLSFSNLRICLLEVCFPTQSRFKHLPLLLIILSLLTRKYTPLLYQSGSIKSLRN